MKKILFSMLLLISTICANAAQEVDITLASLEWNTGWGGQSTNDENGNLIVTTTENGGGVNHIWAELQDWSKYAKLTVEFASFTNNPGASLGIWNKEQNKAVGNLLTVVINGTTAVATIDIDPSLAKLIKQLRILSSTIDNTIVVSRIYLTERDETTTGIEQTVDSEQLTGDIYTLSGIKISGKLPRGIYIQNGKKFIVK